MKRCIITNCKKKCNNDGLCKNHRCRCSAIISMYQAYNGCRIHNTKTNLTPKIKE
jgi:hypothetical protein